MSMSPEIRTGLLEAMLDDLIMLFIGGLGHTFCNFADYFGADF